MLTIGFTGDISFSGYYDKRYQEDILDFNIINFLQDTDYTVVNMEGPLTEHKDNHEFHHSSPPSSIPFFN